jgi:hypothetical protein
LAIYIVKENKAAVVPESIFSKEEGYVHISFVVIIEQLQEGITLIRNGVGKICRR